MHALSVVAFNVREITYCEDLGCTGGFPASNDKGISERTPIDADGHAVELLPVELALRL